MTFTSPTAWSRTRALSTDRLMGGVPADLDAVFPSTPRVLYERSPLQVVVCQLRFPSLLKIEVGAPAEFQELIRAHFPILERQVPSELAGLPPDMQRALGSTQVAYAFSNESDDELVNLTPDFVAFTSSNYDRWEQFRDTLAMVIGAFEAIYRPSFYSRIGLRYQNVIDPPALGMPDASWSELLSENILGDLGGNGLSSVTLEEARRHLRLRSKLDRTGIYLQHGVALDDVVPRYVIDTDVSIDAKTEVEDAAAALDGLNVIAGRVFRWCITEKLHEAFGAQTAL